MPARMGRPSEIIQVLHSNASTIRVPIREEDLELHSFFERPMSDLEIADTSNTQTWKVFGTWEELEEDHAKLAVGREALALLNNLINRFACPVGIAA